MKVIIMDTISCKWDLGLIIVDTIFMCENEIFNKALFTYTGGKWVLALVDD